MFLGDWIDRFRTGIHRFAIGKAPEGPAAKYVEDLELGQPSRNPRKARPKQRGHHRAFHQLPEDAIDLYLQAPHGSAFRRLIHRVITTRVGPLCYARRGIPEAMREARERIDWRDKCRASRKLLKAG